MCVALPNASWPLRKMASWWTRSMMRVRAGRTNLEAAEEAQDAAAEELVRRLSRRTGRVPRSVVVLDEALPADLDAVLAVDVSHVPRWQPGLRAAASVLRHAARVDLDCELSDMRKWPALLSVSPNQVSVELRRGNVNRVGRIREVSRLGGRVLSLSVR